MAEWIGQLIGQFPFWLLLPAVVLTVIIYFFVVVIFSGPTYIEWPFKGKRHYLGEKKRGTKHDKK